MTDDNVGDIVRSVLRYRLSLRVQHRDIYTPFSEDSLYTRGKVLQLVLDGDEVISEVDIDE